MRHRTIVRIGLLFAFALGAASGRPEVGLSAQQSSQPAAPGIAGQTRTRLADGRVLIVGGDSTPASASLWDPATQKTAPTAGSLIVPRAWHTATLLADGTVLIAGGRSGAAPIATAEIFEPATGLFRQISMMGAVARADHSATLLLDGRVLVAGGIGSGPDPLPVEIWDVTGQSSTTVGTAGVDRQDQRAMLDADGHVLLVGGRTLDGRTVVTSLAVDPATGGVTRAPADRAVDPYLAASIPTAGAVDVETGVHVALRFSVAIAADSISGDRVTLSSPDGILNTAIVTAEDGRLVFVWPDAPLADGVAYTVNVMGLTDASGRPVAPASFQFTTKARASNNDDSADRETWTPNPLDGENGWRSNRPPSPWESLAPLMAPPGVTAVSGRVLRLDGAPLKDVTLEIDGREARTGGSGRFLLPLESWTSRQTTLEIDARTANKPHRTYGFYEARIGIYAGKTNVLPFTIWSPLIDTAHQVTIPSPTTRETLVTTPTMPGLELHLPAGTVIQDEEHRLRGACSRRSSGRDTCPYPA